MSIVLAGIPDACPECDPLTHPASLPDARGVYECPSGHRWQTSRDVYGWPIVRSAVLEALAEQDREARHAAA